MNRLFLILACLATQLLPAQDFNLQWIDEDAAMRRQTFQKTKKTNITTPSGMDIKFHRILLTLDPAVRYVQGSVSTYFIKKNQSITFDMHDSLKVTAIRYHGQLITSYTRLHNKISILLSPQPITDNRQPTTLLDSIMVDYLGIPQDDGSGSFSLSTHHNIPVLYTLSEPYGAMDWWPCSQDLNDKIDSVHLVITVPPGNRAAANGMLVAEQHCDDKSIYQWKHKHPIAAYLVGVSVTNYAVYSDYVPVPGGEPIEVLNYVYPEDSANIRSQTPGIIKPFQLFNQWFGLYPFADERYGHAQWNWGGGMEHQTMSFMGSFGYDLMAHELAHQWFGDFLTCASWRDIWLNEGFATYLTGLCYEADQGGIYWEPFKRLSINRIIKEPGGSVYCYDTTSIDRIFDARLSYSKGAMVLHMLRWEMGDADFFQALNNYLYDPLLANGYATTEDLIRHVEAVSDTTFREFFNDWIYGEGHPTYQLSYRQGANNEVTIELGQEQSDPGVSFFEMDVPVVLYGKPEPLPSPRDGVPTFVGMTSTTVVLKHAYSGQVFTVNPGFKIDSVAFDPERWILTANPIIAGIPQTPLDQEVKIYPNPVQEELTIEFAIPREGRYIRIYNSKGQVMYSSKSTFTKPILQIPMQGFAKGVYSVEIEGEGAYTVVKE